MREPASRPSSRLRRQDPRVIRRRLPWFWSSPDLTQGATSSKPSHNNDGWKPSLLGAYGDSKKRYQNSGAGGECAAHRPGDFRFATPAPAMIDRNLQNAQLLARRFHLHLQIPSVGLLAHSEFLER